jgi:hypothetical protein
MTEPRLELRVELELDPQADAAEIETRTLQLRDELLDLDVDDVRQPSVGRPPEGAKGGDVVLLGTLVVTAGREAVRVVVQAVGAWLSRNRVRSITVRIDGDTLELSAASKDEQLKLVELFLARHSAGGGL